MSVAPGREGLKLHATRPFAANASTPTLPVAELAVLLEVKEGTSDEDIQELIDNLYTVQYYSGAGVTCFSAGEAPGAGPGSYTHAFHARFPNETALENFKRHPQFVAVMDDLVAPACARVTSASFLGEVENDMFAVFMRGDEYDSGVQRMVLIDGGDGAFNGRSGDVIALMAAVAASPVPILQLTCGSVVAGAGGGGPSHAMMIRCYTKADLRALEKGAAWGALGAAVAGVECVDFLVGEVGNTTSATGVLGGL